MTDEVDIRSTDSCGLRERLVMALLEKSPAISAETLVQRAERLAAFIEWREVDPEFTGQNTGVAPASTGDRPREQAQLDAGQPADEGRQHDGAAPDGAQPASKATAPSPVKAGSVQKRPGVLAEVPPRKWNPDRDRIVADHYPTRLVPEVLERLNALPGPQIRLIDLQLRASKLKVRRDPVIALAQRRSSGKRLVQHA